MNCPNVPTPGLIVYAQDGSSHIVQEWIGGWINRLVLEDGAVFQLSEIAPAPWPNGATSFSWPKGAGRAGFFHIGKTTTSFDPLKHQQGGGTWKSSKADSLVSSQD